MFQLNKSVFTSYPPKEILCILTTLRPQYIEEFIFWCYSGQMREDRSCTCILDLRQFVSE